MIDSVLSGQRKEIHSLKNKIKRAVGDKEILARQEACIEQSFENEKISFLEHRQLLNRCRQLDNSYNNLIAGWEKKIARIERGPAQKTSIKNILPVLILGLVAFVLVLSLLGGRGVLTGLFVSENTFVIEGEFRLDLNEFFEVGEGWSYYTSDAENMDVIILNQELVVTPEDGFVGENKVTVYASNGSDMIEEEIILEVAGGFGVGPAPEEVVEEPIVNETVEVVENVTIEPVENVTEPINETTELVVNETIAPEPEPEPVVEEPVNETVPEIIPEAVPETGMTVDSENKLKLDNKFIGKRTDDGEIELYFDLIEKTADKLILEFHHNSDKAENVYVSRGVLDKPVLQPGEKARFEIDLVEGIVSKFVLKAGVKKGFAVEAQYSEVFEIGKTIPVVSSNGNYTLIDRDDEKLNVEIVKDKGRIAIVGVVDEPRINSKIESVANADLTTEVAAVEPMTMERATITIPKTGKVDVIMECSEMDVENMVCLGEWQKTDIIFTDNGDTITFTVDHFSGYGGAELEVLNLQSYPTLEGNWTVEFTTTGTADLRITAVDGTTWSNINEDSVLRGGASGTQEGSPLRDLKFLEVRCGDSVLDYTWVDNSVLIENYYCNETGYETSKVLTTGKHTLKFEFGDDVDYAYNYVYSGGYDMTSQDNISWMGGQHAATGGYLGVTLDWADVNGDGHADAIVGSYYNNSGLGAVYLLYGPLERVTDVDISSKADAAWYGPSVDYVGTCIGTGDLDNDGYDDILIGAHAYDNDALDGRVNVIYGQAAAFSGTTDMDIAADATFTGNVEALGMACDCADINGDDYEDILMTSYGTGLSSDGITYLVYGQSTKFSGDTAVSNANASWTNAGSFGEAYIVRRAGDINSDGYDDFLIGEPAINNTYLYYGQGAKFSGAHTLSTSANATFATATTSDSCGWSVSSAGDFNADGYDDFLIAAPSTDGQELTDNGMVYFFYGGQGYPWSGTIAMSTTYNASFHGYSNTYMAGAPHETGANVYIGGALSYGDFNIDGYSDFLIGSYGADVGGHTDNGEVVLVYGRPAFSSVNGYEYSMDISAGEVNASFYGEVNTDRLRFVPTGMAEDVFYEHIMMGADGFDNGGGGSCPFLYVWDGTEFGFHVDIYPSGRLGSKIASGTLPPQPKDYYLISKESLTAADGKYQLRLVEERDEVDYLDQTELYVVEHTPNTEVVPELTGFNPKYKMKLYLLNETMVPISCITDTGENCTDKLAAQDYDFIGLGDREYLDWHYVELDFGNIPGDAALVFRGYSVWPLTPEGVARRSLFDKYAYIQIYNGTDWVNSSLYLPNPKEITRDAPLNFTGLSPNGNYKVRLHWVHNTFLDQIYMGTISDEEISITKLNITFANLTHHGTSHFSSYPPPLNSDYETANAIPSNYKYYDGNYTRYGDVLELLNKTDDKFAIFHAGDEIQLEWDAYNPTQDYDFMLYSYGYYKDRKAAINTPNMTEDVEPLPFHDMSNFPYPDNESYPDDEEHNNYRLTYNTRERIHGEDVTTSLPHSDEGKVYVMEGALNHPPAHDTPILNATSVDNLTLDDLIVYVQNVSDVENDSVTNITDWRKDGTSIAVLNMPFDTNDSLAVDDYSDYVNDGTVNGTTWTSSGILGGAYEFKRTNTDYIEITDDASLNLTGDITLEAWIKSDSIGVAQYIISKPLNDGMGNMRSYPYTLYLSQGKICMRVYIDGWSIYAAGSNNTVCSDNNVSEGTWSHVVGTYDNSTGLTSIYINGTVNKSAVRTTQDAGLTKATPVFIGSEISTLGVKGWSAFNGTIDEVRIYNRTLSAEQVAANYNNSDPKYDKIVSEETVVDDIWQACITPNDRTDDGITKCSNNLTILNTAPTQGRPILNSTDPSKNNTNQNLTVYNQSTSDDDDHAVKNIINWYKDGGSITEVHMPFEGGGNATHDEDGFTKDYSGHGNNGSTAGGITWSKTGGYDGKGAYEFDGINGQITIADDATLNVGDKITVMTWVKADTMPDDGGATFRTIASRTRVYDDANTVWYLVYAENDGKLYFAVGNGASRIQSLNSFTAPDSNWQHIAGVYNGSHTLLYINGSLINVSSSTVSSIKSTNNNILIGEDSGRPWNGTIDELIIFNRSLSAEQIKVLYENRTDLIVSQETAVDDVWQACITPNDGTDDGTENCSNDLTVINNIPTQGRPILNSTDPHTNSTDQNLTVYNQSTDDADEDAVKNIINWYKDNTSFTMLNMPFEGGLLAEGETKVKDYSQFGNNGTVTEAIYQGSGGYDGKGAYWFDGSNDYIDCGADNSVNQTEEMTLSAWIKYDAVTDNYGALMAKSDGAGITAGWRLHWNNANPELRFLLALASGNKAITSPSLTASTWYHVATTFNGTGMAIYVNGTLVSSTSFAATTIKPATNALRIGADNQDLNFKGTIDEAMIFNHSLSAEQIQVLYQNRTDLIVSQETSIEDVWKACLTPNDGTVDGVENCSNDLTVLRDYALCGDTLQANNRYVLKNDTSSTGTCFTIPGDNIEIDCRGYKITGPGGTGVSYAIYSAAARTNLTLKNCWIEDFNRGVYRDFVNSKFINNTFNYTRTCGIHLRSASSYLNISGNTFIDTGKTSPANSNAGSYSIFLDSADNVDIYHNTFTRGLGSEIYFNGASTNRNIKHNYVDKDNINNEIFYFLTVTGSATVENNTFVNVGAGWAYYLTSVNTLITFVGTNLVDGENASNYFVYNRNNTIIENLNHNGSERVLNWGNFVAYNCDNLTVRNNNFTNHHSYSNMYLRSVDNSDIYNNNIINRTTGGTYNFHIYHCDNLNIFSNEIKDTQADGLKLDTCSGAQIYDNNISASTSSGSYAFDMYSTAAGHGHAVIKNNNISGGSYSAYFAGTSSTALTNVSFFNNSISGMGSTGIHLNAGMIDVSNNTITCPNNHQGIHLVSATGNHTVFGNQINNCRYGLALQRGESRIQNNTITTRTATPTQTWGVHVQNVDNHLLNVNLTRDNTVDGKAVPYYFKESAASISDQNINLTKLISTGITLIGSNDMVIDNNNITGNDATIGGAGITLLYSNYTNITHNNFHDFNYAINLPYYLDQSERAYIAHNYFNSSKYGIYFSVNVQYKVNYTIFNNTFYQIGTNPIYRYCSATAPHRNSRMNITGNLFNYSASRDMHLGNCVNNTIEGNRFDYTGTQSIYFYNADQNTIKNNNFTNIRTDGTSAYYIYIQSGSSNNNITGNRFTGSPGYPYYGLGVDSSNNNHVSGNYFNNSRYAIYYFNTASGNPTYNNEIYSSTTAGFRVANANNQNIYNNTVCYNKQAVSFTNAAYNLSTVGWHNNLMCVNSIIPENGTTIQDTTPEIFFHISNLMDQSSTNCSAVINGVENGYNDTMGADGQNQTIQVSNALASGENFLQINCTDDYNDTLVFHNISFNVPITCSDIADDIIMFANISADLRVCFNITTNNITIDCDGYTLIGNGSVGIQANGYDGLTIKNCVFENFTQDIIFDNSDNGTVENTDVIINITNSENAVVNLSDVDWLYITNSTNVRVVDSIVRNYTFANATFFMMENSTYGQLKFLKNVSGIGTNLFVNSSSDIVWESLSVGVNSVNQPAFNISANVSLYNVLQILPQLYVNISGNWTLCNETTSPSCYNLSYANQVYIFNVSHFTSFISKEFAGLIQNFSWPAHLPRAGYEGTIILIDIDKNGTRDLHITGSLDTVTYYNEVHLNTGDNFSKDTSLSGDLKGVSYSGAAWGDYNRDGYSDLVYCGKNATHVMTEALTSADGKVLNRDIPSIGNLTDVAYCSVVFGDVDVDGDLDLALQGQIDPTAAVCEVYTNNDGVFNLNVTLSSNCTGKYDGELKFVDVNNDSFVDLLSIGVTLAGTPLIEVMINGNGNKLELNTSYYNLLNLSKATLNYGDMDNDGLRDIIYHGTEAGGGSSRTVWYKNTGSGFTEVGNHDMKNLTQGAICIVDFNNDGWRDVYMSGNELASGNYHADVYLNNGDGSGLFKSYQYSINLSAGFRSACATADVENASHADLVATWGSGGPDNFVGGWNGNPDTWVVPDNARPTAVGPPNVEANDMGGGMMEITMDSGDGDDDVPPRDEDNGDVVGYDAKDIVSGDILISNEPGQVASPGSYDMTYPAKASTAILRTSITNVVDVSWWDLDEGYELSDISDTTTVWIADVFEVVGSLAAIIVGDDCYLSTDNTTLGSHTIPCSNLGNWSTLNLSITPRTPYNLTVHCTKNITAEFGDGTENNNYIGKVQNTSYTGNRTIIADAWVLANYNASSLYPIMLVQNGTFTGTNHNYTIEVGKELDVLTPVGNYNNTIVFTVWV